MSVFEVLVSILTSGVFLGVLAIFYRMGRSHEFMESKFQSIDDKFRLIDDKFRLIDDKFRLIDERFLKLDERLEKIEQRLNSIERDLGTRIAVIESRLSDISINVTHLMWHSQAIPPKEEANQG